MNRLAVLLVLVFPLSLTARADDASLHAKAQQLIVVLHTDRMVQQVSDNLTQKFSQTVDQIVNNNPTPEQAKQIADYEKKASQTIDAQLSWSAIQSSFVDLYAKTFTEDQMDAIIAFYKSPAGIAFLDKTPVLNSQVTQILQTRIATAQGQLRDSVIDFKQHLAPAQPPTTSSLPAQSSPAPKN